MPKKPSSQTVTITQQEPFLSPSLLILLLLILPLNPLCAAVAFQRLYCRTNPLNNLLHLTK